MKRKKKEAIEEARAIRERLKASGFKQGFIAIKAGISEQAFSRYMNGHPDYITANANFLLKIFIEKYLDVKNS